MSDFPRYFIQSLERGAWGNSAVFWKEKSCGYTSNLEEAGRYTAEEAEQIKTDDDIPLECSMVEAMSRRHVDFGQLNQRKKEITAAEAAELLRK